MILPVDVVALSPGGEFGCGSPGSGEVKLFGSDIPIGWKGLDIGPKSAEVFAAAVQRGEDGSMERPDGCVRGPRFASGTTAVAEAVAASFGEDGRRRWGLGGGSRRARAHRRRSSFVSTGGGATLELLEYGDLPGLQALRSASNAPKAPLQPAHRAPERQTQQPLPRAQLRDEQTP